MFEIGELVIYGSYGVCRVAEVGIPDAQGLMKSMYYTLEPYYKSGSKIFTPVDNKKVVMRKIVSKKEAIELIDEIKNIEALWITDEKKRETEYKDAVRKYDLRELVKIIKTICLRAQVRLTEGKKTTASDDKYFRMAEDNFYGELAVSLGMDKDAVKEFVLQRGGTMETVIS